MSTETVVKCGFFLSFLFVFMGVTVFGAETEYTSRILCHRCLSSIK